MRWMMAAVLLAACGGGTPKGTTAAEDPVEHGPSDQMASPEKIEDIQRSFRARRSIVSRCYGEASLAGKLTRPRAKGRVTVLSRISTAGRATSVKVTDSTLNEPAVEECLTQQIMSWEIPKPDVDLDFSFTYEVAPD
jgi:hypothetical protein